MSLSPETKIKYLSRIDALIAEGENLVKEIKFIPGRPANYRWLERQNSVELPTQDRYIIEDKARIIKWQTNCITILESILPKNSAHINIVNQLEKSFENPKSALPWALGKLQAIREDFSERFLEDISKHIETEVVSDLMGQAEGLLNDGQFARLF
jgi:hypothetical protein